MNVFSPKTLLLLLVLVPRQEIKSFARKLYSPLDGTNIIGPNIHGVLPPFSFTVGNR